MTRHASALGTLIVFFLAVCPALAQQPAIGQKGLLAHWKFDEGQGDMAADSSGNGFDGDLYAAEWVRGPFGTALRFNGEDAYVQVPEIAALNGSDELTVEAWVFWEGTGRYPNILTGGRWSPGGFLIFVSDDTCSFRMGRPGASATQPGSGWTETSTKLVSPIVLGRWYHLAATFKRPKIQTYVNGEPVGSANWDYPVGHAGDLIVGKWARKPCHNGLIDEVKLYKRELSHDEVKASYESEARRRIVVAGAKAYEKIPPEVSREPAALTLENSASKLLFDKRLRAIALLDKRTGQSYLANPSTFVTARVGSQRCRPSAFQSSATVPVAGVADTRLTIEFGGSGIKADLAA
ncbi:MAG: LamG domain-containing protein, partial [Planctomycetes bacterium]|nr:LamG domain-containing protein [Planctomycetota bacterium]